MAKYFLLDFEVSAKIEDMAILELETANVFSFKYAVAD